MRNSALLLFLLSCTAPVVVVAAEPMKPGLYEYTVRIEMPGMPTALPPSRMQHCLTQEQLARNDQYQGGGQEDCQVTNLKETGSKVTFDVDCKGSRGRAEYSHDASGMTGRTVMDLGGQAAVTHLRARRVGDCR